MNDVGGGGHGIGLCGMSFSIVIVLFLKQGLLAGSSPSPQRLAKIGKSVSVPFSSIML